MGIPRFYKFITEQFPTVTRHTSFKQGWSQQVDNLYLDANGILHTCAREIFFEAPDRRYKPLARKSEPTPAQKELKLFQAICAYMDQLLKFVKPAALFYIAIDGPAPLAKQAQQRQRRYKAADEKTPEQLAIFDTTAITPGTSFMYKLGKYIHFYIRKMISTDPAWKHITVIFSGADVAGEGEHKIAQYIRDEPNAKELCHCMYGLDADLFMLSLGTHCPKFYLLREDQFTTVWNDTLFHEVDIGLLRTEIFDCWGTLGGNPERLIDDFIFAGFLVGNDFLHALPSCHDLAESIVFIMDLRQQTLGSNYITSGTRYNLNNLANLLVKLAETEAAGISDLFFHQNFPNVTVNNSLIDPNRPRLGVDLNKYRTLYYAKAGIDHSDRDAVWDFCKHYLQGLEWVQHYYHAQAVNWRWYYPFHYSPLVTDLVGYLSNAGPGSTLTRVSKQAAAPILPFQQLLCVVPPKSSALLPGYLQPLYTGALAKFYPKEYRLDLEGKRKEWEAIAILPFIDIDRVIEAYTLASKGQKILARNALGNTWLLHRDVGARHDYTSPFGKIARCPVKVLAMSNE